MKKRITALALAFVMVLGTVAVAAGAEKTITVTPMTMTINGQTVTPTKSDGTPAEVFAYDGATYVPLRYLSELLGIQVEWDKNDSSTAKLVGDNLKVPAAAGYQDGTFTGSAYGMNGDVPVTVVVSGGKITSVTVGEHKETPGIGTMAVDAIPGAIVKARSADVDVTTGASITSNAIMQAVKNALGGAKAEVNDVGSVDVIVVGGGLAGMMASLRVAQLGGKALLLEQSGRTGGSSIYSTDGFISGCNTQMQRDAGIQDNGDKFFKEIVDVVGTDDMDVDLAKFFCNNSGAAVDWLEKDMGVGFRDRSVGYGVYVQLPTARVYMGTNGFPGVDATLLERIQENPDNITLKLNTLVTDLLLDDKGEVCGVKAKLENGETAEYKAPSVILATGGYGYSESLLKTYNFTNVSTMDPVTSIGSGFDMALALGAEVQNMDFCSCYGGGIPNSGFDCHDTVNVSYPGFVWVDNTGARVADEMGADSEVRSETWKTVPENYVYVVFDEDMIKNDYKFAGKPSDDPAANKAQLDQLVADGYAFHAETLEELGKKMGIDAKAFANTMNQYNADCAKGKDSVFGRTENLVPFKSGSYYGIPTIPYVLMTSGGLKINTDTQVLKTDGTPIANLYAAGEIIGTANIIGKMTYGGIGHGVCATFGLQAAECAYANAK